VKIFWTKKRGWEVDGTIARQRIREHGFATKKALEEFIVELKIQVKRGKYGLERDRPRVLLSALIEERSSDLNPKDDNDRACIAILRRFEKHFPVGFSLGELTTSHLRAFVKERQRVAITERGRKLEAGTINKDLMTISGMLRGAPDIFPEIGAEWRPPRIPWERLSRRGSERIITPAERRALLEGLRLAGATTAGGRLGARYVEARRDVADVLEIALHTGMRGGEVLRLRWTDVDLDAAEVHLPKTKNNEPRDVPCNRRAVEILSRRFERRRLGQWVFPGSRGAEVPRSRDSYTAIVGRVARFLGLRYGRGVDGGFTPHATRHTAATEMMRAQNDPSAVQKVLGHSDHTMTLRYTHADRGGMRAAVDSLVEQKTGNRLTVGRQKVDKDNSGEATKRG
jgi:integrase